MRLYGDNKKVHAKWIKIIHVSEKGNAICIRNTGIWFMTD